MPPSTCAEQCLCQGSALVPRSGRAWEQWGPLQSHGQGQDPHLNRALMDLGILEPAHAQNNSLFLGFSPPRPHGVTCAMRGGLGKATVPLLEKQHN